MTNYTIGEMTTAGGVSLIVTDNIAMIKIVRWRERPIFAWFKSCRHWCELLPERATQTCCECRALERTRWCEICKL